MGHAETELTEGRALMVMNSAGLIAPPVRGISQAFTWLLIGSFGKELFVLVLELMRVIPYGAAREVTLYDYVYDDQQRCRQWYTNMCMHAAEKYPKAPPQIYLRYQSRINNALTIET